MRLIPRLIFASALAICAVAHGDAAQIRVFERAQTPRSQTQVHRFDLQPGQPGLAWSTVANLRSGTVSFRLSDPSGQVIAQFAGRQMFTGPGMRSGDKAPAGTYTLEVTATKAVGRWQAQVSPLPTRRDLALQLVGCAAMVLVAAAAVAYWRRSARVGGRRGERPAAAATWRWFWLGAGLWVVGVAIKIIVSLLMNQRVLEFLDVMLPYPAFVLAGGLYVGVISAICEIGLVAVIALLWRRMAGDADRAVALGIGAGAFEAALLGIAGAGAAAAALLSAGQAGDIMRASAAMLTVATPLGWLVAPVERALVIPCHVAARATALLGVARRRWMPLVVGLVLFTAIDTLAGIAHVSGRLGMFSMWWLELALLPFTLISIALIARCVRIWPTTDEVEGAGGGAGGGGAGDDTGAAITEDASPVAPAEASPAGHESAPAFASTTPPSPHASPGR